MKKETNVKEFLMKYGFVIILILVTAFFGITTNNFITVKNLFSILHNAAPVFAFCVGAAMVIMSGMVDLSIGSTMYLSAAIGTILIVRKNVPIILALLAVAAICIIIGIINGLVIDKFDMSPMIATMATMIVIRGLAQYITNSVVISLPDYLRKLNSLKIGGIYIDIFIAAIVLILTEIVHRRTSFGRYVTTIGNDKKVAEKLGVNVRKTTVKMYVYSALMAGVAGISGIRQLIEQNKDKVSERYSEDFINKASGKEEEIFIGSIVNILRQQGIDCYMHDVSEGGIFGALWDMCEYGHMGLDVDIRSIPVRQEIIEICELLNINPYELESMGCLLMTADNDCDIINILNSHDIKASVIGHLTKGNQRILRNRDEERFLDIPKQDELYRGSKQ